MAQYCVQRQVINMYISVVKSTLHLEGNHSLKTRGNIIKSLRGKVKFKLNLTRLYLFHGLVFKMILKLMI